MLGIDAYRLPCGLAHADVLAANWMAVCFGAIKRSSTPEIQAILASEPR